MIVATRAVTVVGMSLESETRPSKGVAYFVIGGILLLVGLVGVVAYATALPDAALAPTEATGPLRGLTIIVAALATGAGVLLVALGVVKRRARRRG